MTRTQRPVGLVRLGLGAAALVAVVLAPASVAAAGSKVAPRIPLAGASVIGSGFNRPYAISSDGTHVWVANYGGNSVTELAAATGALVKVISGSSYGFNYPDAVSSDGTDVWVANYNGQSVTELPAS
jgi:DNA-binding beta-propeller fold protein YncE